MHKKHNLSIAWRNVDPFYNNVLICLYIVVRYATISWIIWGIRSSYILTSTKNLQTQNKSLVQLWVQSYYVGTLISPVDANFDRWSSNISLPVSALRLRGDPTSRTNNIPVPLTKQSLSSLSRASNPHYTSEKICQYPNKEEEQSILHDKNGFHPTVLGV